MLNSDVTEVMPIFLSEYRRKNGEKFIILEVITNYQEATIKRVLLNIEHLRPELLFKIKERVYMKW